MPQNACDVGMRAQDISDHKASAQAKSRLRRFTRARPEVLFLVANYREHQFSLPLEVWRCRRSVTCSVRLACRPATDSLIADVSSIPATRLSDPESTRISTVFYLHRRGRLPQQAAYPRGRARAFRPAPAGTAAFQTRKYPFSSQGAFDVDKSHPAISNPAYPRQPFLTHLEDTWEPCSCSEGSKTCCSGGCPSSSPVEQA